MTLLLFERRDFIFNFARINAGVYFFAYRCFKLGVLNQFDYDLFNGFVYLVLAPLTTIIAKMPIYLTSVFANIVYDVMNALLRARMLEEAGSFSNLDEYKAARRMGALMYGSTQSEAIEEFIKKRGCSKATVIRFLKIAQLMLSTSPLENDAEASYSWDYADVLWDGVCAEKVREAFAKLSFREQTLLEKRSAICMTCGRVAPLSERASFEDLAIEFESSSPRTAERAYLRAVERLTLNLVELGELHAVRIECVVPGIYRYQADSDGCWGEFTLDPVTGELQVAVLAELDTTKTHRFAKQAARYLKAHAGEKLPKRMLVAFE